MPESQLPTRKGIDLFQQELEGLPEPAPVRRHPVKRPTCWDCHDLGLPTEYIARPGGRWACARGHGLLGP